MLNYLIYHYYYYYTLLSINYCLNYIYIVLGLVALHNAGLVHGFVFSKLLFKIKWFSFISLIYFRYQFSIFCLFIHQCHRTLYFINIIYSFFFNLHLLIQSKSIILLFTSQLIYLYRLHFHSYVIDHSHL